MTSIIDSGPRFWRVVDLAANRASGEVATQIVELNHEIFVLMCNAIKAGIADGAFRRDLNPAEAATVFTLLLESIPRMRPDLAKVLENQGIDERKFAMDIGDFIGFMLASKEKAKK